MAVNPFSLVWPFKQGSALRDSLDLLFTRRFGTFWFAGLLSNIGTWAQQVAQPWLLITLGASPFLIGLDTFAMSAPVFLLTLAGGLLADHADRRLVVVGFQSLQMMCPIILVALILSGRVEPWMIIMLSLIVGITDALSMPSFQTIVPSIVEHGQIPRAIALNSTQFNLSRILGPSLAGVTMASIGAAGAFAVNAASYVPFLAVAIWILPRGVSQALTPDMREHHKLFAGVREIARDPGLRLTLLTVLVTSALCSPLVTFCPVLVRDAFHGDISHFSVTIGAFGVGGLLGAIGLLAVDIQRDRRRICSRFAAGYGVVVMLCALNTWSWGLPLLFLLAGIAMTVSNTSANGILQSMAPARIRGQTASLHMLAIRGGLALGSLITGIVVSSVGIHKALLINGVAAVIIQLALGIAWMRVRTESAD